MQSVPFDSGVVSCQNSSVDGFHVHESPLMFLLDMAAVADRRCLDGGARTVPAWTFPPLPKKIPGCAMRSALTTGCCWLCEFRYQEWHDKQSPMSCMTADCCWLLCTRKIIWFLLIKMIKKLYGLYHRSSEKSRNLNKVFSKNKKSFLQTLTQHQKSAILLTFSSRM